MATSSIGEAGWVGLFGDGLDRLEMFGHQLLQRRREVLGPDEIEWRQLVGRVPGLQQRVGHEVS
ncbi:hypothetical protein PWG14_21780 (plasmid) [Chromobacterium amazonense]|uniref:hypothetical protein n=1 Tax=Chromobacterium amazonense TaxID=1382803 RepID=UPI00237E7887|nr:hypothetical protein [Chromobacterium amazonense]MDE1715104.1 hypothetical protein [Chromobacterium amazonense]